MRKVLVTFVLALTMGAFAAAQQPTGAETPTSQKVIKDPAEYNAYIAALNTTDPMAKAQAMEAFVTKYPQSIVKIDALEQAMAAYQAASNQAKVEETASRILEINPSNIRALAIVTFIERAKVRTPDDAKKVRADAEKGLTALPSWQKPEGVTPEEFEKLKKQMAEIFYGAAGFGALNSKDYTAARDYYLKSFQLDPNNLQDIYQLGIAYLEMDPIDVNGLWYIAKAYNLANEQAKPTIGNYGKAKYKKYHGGVDGWDKILADAATQPSIPAGFDTTIAKAPTPPELAVKAVQENPPDQLSFADWEFILQYRDVSPANKDAADKVWTAIQAKQKGGEAKLKIPVMVIAATADSFDAAITEDNQQAKKADLHVVMEKPMTKLPAVGSTIDIIGVLSSYTPNPFMFTMEKGELPPPPKPVRKPPVRRPVHKKK